MPDWRYILGKSPAPGEDPTQELESVGYLRQAKDKALDLAINRGGSAGFNYPMLEKKWAPYLFSGPDYCIIAERDGETQWTGPLATNQGSTTTSKGGTTAIKAVGWRELLTVRELREDVDYGPVNAATGLPWTDAEIVFDLLARVIAYDPDHAPPIRQGNAYGTRYSRQKKWSAGTKIESCFRELEDIEAGIDIVIDPITRLLHVYSWDSYVDRPEIQLGFNKPPNNVEQFSWNIDFFSIRNRMEAKGAENIASGIQVDTASMDRYNIFEETVNLPGVKTNETLVYYAAGEVALKSFPVVHYTITPKTWEEGKPQFNKDFFLRDRIRWSVDFGPLQEIEQPVRVFGISLAVDAGKEKITKFDTQMNSA